MSCLNKEILLKKIDGELLDHEVLRVDSHLAGCETCKCKVAQLTAERENLFMQLDKLNPPRVHIPDFVVPQPIIHFRKKRRIHPAFNVAAAVLLFFVWVISQLPESPKISQQEVLLQMMFDGEDPNKLWHDKEMMILLIDENNELIMSYRLSGNNDSNL